MAPEDRLRFAVKFAVMPLDRLRAGDWLNLKEDVAAFLSSQILSGNWESLPLSRLIELRPTFSNVTDFPERMPLFQAKMTLLQPEVRAILDAQAVDLDAEGCIDGDATVRRMEAMVPKTPHTLLAVTVIHRPLFSAVMGTVEAVFHWQLQHLITSTPIGKVAHCRECDTIFYRVKQQVYCSRACTNRVSTRRFRERQETENRTLHAFAAAADARPRTARSPEVPGSSVGMVE
jgi:hypothetical protein